MLTICHKVQHVQAASSINSIHTAAISELKRGLCAETKLRICTNALFKAVASPYHPSLSNQAFLLIYLIFILPEVLWYCIWFLCICSIHIDQNKHINFCVTSPWRHIRENGKKAGKWQNLFLTINMIKILFSPNSLYFNRVYQKYLRMNSLT